MGSKRAIGDISESVWKQLLHARARWPTAVHFALWPYAIRNAVLLHNSLPVLEDGTSRLELFSSIRAGCNMKHVILPHALFLHWTIHPFQANPCQHGHLVPGWASTWNPVQFMHRMSMGLTICHKNEFVQSRFLDGFLNCPVQYNLVFWMVFLIVPYINKMATDRGGGAVDGRHGDDCKRNIGPGLKSQPGNNFFH